jgi:hypothetical protein
MAQIDLNDGLAQHLVKPGDKSRNPTGKNGTPALRLRNRDIRAMLWAEGNQPCDEPGFEHLTKLQRGVRAVLDKFQEGDRWAVKFVTERLFGRVPINVDMTMTNGNAYDVGLMHLTDEELAARLDALRAQLTSPTTIDVQPEPAAAPEALTSGVGAGGERNSSGPTPPEPYGLTLRPATRQP